MAAATAVHCGRLPVLVGAPKLFGLWSDSCIVVAILKQNAVLLNGVQREGFQPRRRTVFANASCKVQNTFCKAAKPHLRADRWHKTKSSVEAKACLKDQSAPVCAPEDEVKFDVGKVCNRRRLLFAHPIPLTKAEVGSMTILSAKHKNSPSEQCITNLLAIHPAGKYHTLLEISIICY